MKYYVNGVLTAANGGSDFGTYVAMQNTSTPLEIAGRNGFGKLAGSLDDVRIYSRVLSASEVTAIYNGTQ